MDAKTEAEIKSFAQFLQTSTNISEGLQTWLQKKMLLTLHQSNSQKINQNFFYIGFYTLQMNFPKYLHMTHIPPNILETQIFPDQEQLTLKSPFTLAKPLKLFCSCQHIFWFANSFFLSQGGHWWLKFQKQGTTLQLKKNLRNYLREFGIV